MINEVLNPTPRELAQISNWKDVQKSLRFFYGGKWTKAIEVFERIKNAPTVKHKDPAEFLEVYCGGFITLDKEDMEDRSYNIHTNKYSLSFRKWDELSNIPFAEETMRKYRTEDLLAHFIWEITWYGVEKDSLKKGKELFETVAKIKKEHKH